jgi:hypothetical protein
MKHRIVLELWGYLRTRKKYWLVPILLVLIFVGGVFALSAGTVVAPFIYTLF